MVRDRQWDEGSGRYVLVDATGARCTPARRCRMCGGMHRHDCAGDRDTPALGARVVVVRGEHAGRVGVVQVVTDEHSISAHLVGVILDGVPPFAAAGWGTVGTWVQLADVADSAQLRLFCEASFVGRKGERFSALANNRHDGS